MGTYLRNGAGEIVARLPSGSAVGSPREKIRIEPIESPVPKEAPAPVETPSEVPEKVPA